MHGRFERHTHAPSDEHGKFCRSGWRRMSRVAVVATLSKGYDLNYIWKQVDLGPVKDAAGYYLQARQEAPGQRPREGLSASAGPTRARR